MRDRLPEIIDASRFLSRGHDVIVDGADFRRCRRRFEGQR